MKLKNYRTAIKLHKIILSPKESLKIELFEHELYKNNPETLPISSRTLLGCALVRKKLEQVELSKLTSMLTEYVAETLPFGSFEAEIVEEIISRLNHFTSFFRPETSKQNKRDCDQAL